MKQYLVGWTENPQYPDVMDYWFSPEPKKAKRWPREQVEDECVSFTSTRITVRSETGESQTCTFRYEELGPDSFGIYCEIPFTPEQGIPRP
jgi:hypothetical protein